MPNYVLLRLHPSLHRIAPPLQTDLVVSHEHTFPRGMIRMKIVELVPEVLLVLIQKGLARNVNGVVVQTDAVLGALIDRIFVKVRLRVQSIKNRNIISQVTL